MTRTLWRLDGASNATLVQPHRLEQGLRLHLQHTELTTVLMQIGTQQQAYVSLQGCEGCVHGRCTPGCYVELLRRLLRICFDTCTLRAVTGGLAKRPYRSAALAWPAAKAEPLASLSLVDWSEARLIVQWRGGSQQVDCVVLLAVGADGPDPASALRAVGWKTLTLPGPLGPKRANSSLPLSLPFARACSHAPSLLWPGHAALGVQECGETAPSEDSVPQVLTAPVGALAKA